LHLGVLGLRGAATVLSLRSPEQPEKRAERRRRIQRILVRALVDDMEGAQARGHEIWRHVEAPTLHKVRP
jgi:hypothetical protein